MKEPTNKKFVCEKCGATFNYGLLLRKHYRQTGHGFAGAEEQIGSDISPEDSARVRNTPNEFQVDNALSELTKNLQWEKMLTDGGSNREVLSLALKADERQAFALSLRTVARDFALETGVLLPSFSVVDGERRILSWGEHRLGEVQREISGQGSDLLGILKKNSHRFLSFRQVEARLKNLWKDRPELQRAFDEVGMTVTRTVKVLRELLKEGRSIKNFPTVVESLILAKSQYSNQSDLEEAVRRDLGLPRTESPEKPNNRQASMADDITVDLGRGLLDLIDPKKGESLCRRVASLRTSLAQELGWVIPGIRFRDDLRLEPNTFKVLIRDEECFRGEVHPGLFIGIAPQHIVSALRGLHTTDPIYGMPAVWVSPEIRTECEQAGAVLFTAESVVAMALATTLRTRAASLFSYGYFVHGLLKNIADSYPALAKVFEDSPKLCLKAKLVCCRLLEERVSIKNQVTILETVLEFEEKNLAAEEITEIVRARLGRAVCEQYLQDPNKLFGLVLANELVELCLAVLDRESWSLKPDYHQQRKLRQSMKFAIENLRDRHALPEVLIAPSELRRPLRDFFHKDIPSLAVLSEEELPASVEVSCLGEVEARFTPPPGAPQPFPRGRRDRRRLRKFKKR